MKLIFNSNVHRKRCISCYSETTEHDVEQNRLEPPCHNLSFASNHTISCRQSRNALGPQKKRSLFVAARFDSGGGEEAAFVVSVV